MIVPLEKPGTPQELTHFGIKGMKWGVRKERETSGRSKGLSKRKLKRIKRAEEDVVRAQAAIDKLNSETSRNFYTKRVRAGQVKELQKFRDQRRKDAIDMREGRLTDFQKKVLIGAGVTAAVVAAYGTYRLVDSGTARQLLSRNPLKTNSFLSKSMRPEELLKHVVAPINPNYGEIGTKMNCRRCTFAYELRRRGMDVKATKSVRGLGQNVPGLMNALDPRADYKTDRVSTVINVAKEQKDLLETGVEGPFTKMLSSGGGLGKHTFGQFHRGSTPDDVTRKVFDTLEAVYPPGARGEIGMKWHFGGAHSMAWEKVGEELRIFDTQTGKMYNADRFLKEIAPRMSSAGYTRLDNVPLNESFLRRWVTNVG